LRGALSRRGPMPYRETFVICSGHAERLAQDERGSTDGPRLIAPTLHFDLNLTAEIGEGLFTNRAHNRIQEWSAKIRAFTTDDEHLGIQERDHVGHSQSELLAGTLDYLERRGSSVRTKAIRSSREISRPGVRQLCGVGVFANHGFKAPESAAFTQWSAGVNDHVSEFARCSIRPSVERAINDDAQPDATTDRQNDKVMRVMGVTSPFFGDGERVDVILNPHRHAQMATKRFGEFDI